MKARFGAHSARCVPMSKDGDEYDFEEQLDFGLKWERRVKPYIKQNLTALLLNNIEFDEDPERQLAGVDYETEAVEPDVDIKTYRHEHIAADFLCIETASVIPVEANIQPQPGWFYTSDSDYMIVVGENKAGTGVYHRGWIMPFETGVREWFDEALEAHDWDFATVPNGEYNTGVFWVPAADFPDEYLFEFDPRPPRPDSADPNQLDLSQWGGRR